MAVISAKKYNRFKLQAGGWSNIALLLPKSVSSLSTFKAYIQRTGHDTMPTIRVACTLVSPIEDEVVATIVAELGKFVFASGDYAIDGGATPNDALLSYYEAAKGVRLRVYRRRLLKG